MARKDLSKVLIVDVEATCWEGQPPGGQVNEIIEIGCALFDLNEGKTKSKGILVKPAFSQVSEFCTHLTTITQALLDDQGIPFPDAVAQLRNDFGAFEVTWGSWGDYDRKQFDKNCALYNVRYPFGPTHLNVKNLFALKHRLPKELGMEQALNFSRLPLIGTHHRGVDDAVNIASLFKTLV